jgi:hypothetical protein
VPLELIHPTLFGPLLSVDSRVGVANCKKVHRIPEEVHLFHILKELLDMIVIKLQDGRPFLFVPWL